MSSNKHLKSKAICLRKDGKSYNEIIKILGIRSKGTLSNWFKDIKLSEKSLNKLSKNNALAYKRGLHMANKIRREKIDQENLLSYKKSKDNIGRISKETLKIIGASLYWAEGMKSERVAPSLIFSNSDPNMIKVYLRFVREILNISEEKIRAGIHIYSSIKATEAKKFWSSITGLPIDRFYIVNQISISSKRLRPFNILPYGTAIIKINSRIQFFKMKGMIDGMISKLT